MSQADVGQALQWGVFAGAGVWTAWLLLRLLRGRLAALRLAAAEDRREPPLWSGGDVVVALASYLAVQILAASLIRPLLESGAIGMPAASFLCVAAAAPAALAVSVWRVRGVLGQPLSTLGLAAAPGRNYLITPVVYLLSLLPVACVAAASELLLRHGLGLDLGEQEAVHHARDAAGRGEWTNLALLGGAAVAIAPVIEEILFRGVLYTWLRARLGVGLSTVIAGGAFGAAHLSLLKLAPLWVLGMLLSLLYERTRSLYPGMLYHAIFNAGSLAVIALTPGLDPAMK